ncbi:G2/mitotic-specific cyclin-B [Pestalotiopsis fici W106-1]|uniref:G2/mitotic-specific cyclin-B n=1 Tax=Pestalotiopsis fici (strain W106-1 / CGMCC3.15140) TaxID=1229662 RepID=W3XPC5_PESFW|nr:G2/mitotic-specific cyclin-B [Pestalotiopsis fici W106-1]ETS87367.1 G2/mitotic-specific cyclin-B [Pestalotiopsis fici W106-1]
MPPGRPATRRLVTNENDENSSTRMTRAKAAALDVDVNAPPTKPTLQSKKPATTTAANGRRRAALGDVTNAGKVEVTEGKKAATAKTGLVSKAAQPTGVQKPRATTTRTALASKEAAKKTEVKRAGSGSGAIGASSTKRKVATTTVKQDKIAEEGEPVRKKVHTLVESEKVVEVANDENAKVDSVTEKVSQPEPAPQEKHKYPPGVKDLDSEDLDDPLMAAEYANEIFEYLRDLECESVPNPEYMAHQDDLEWKTRGILIDWLIEVHTRFHLLPETLFLAINIIDRFLSEKVVQLDRLQLVGITAMFIASKYEEVLSPHVANFVHVADDGFSEQEILSAERFVLSTLDFNLSYPNPMNFLRRISKADNYDIQSRTIGKYLMEISLVDHRFMAYRSSHIAAAAMYLSRMILDRGPWDETLSYYAGYTEEEIEPVFLLMVDYLARPVIHEAFYKKYASKKFLKASLLTRQWAKRCAPELGITDTKLSLDELEP